MQVLFKILVAVSFVVLTNPSYCQKLNGRIKSYSDNYYSVREIYGKIKKGAGLNDSLYHNQITQIDPNGNIAVLIENNADGTLHCKYVGKSDFKNNHVESLFVRFEPEMVLDMKPFLIGSVKYPSGEMCEITYENDQNGVPVEESIYDLMGTLLNKISIKRDERGLPIQYTFSNGAIYKYKYDEAGRRIEWFTRSASNKTAVTNYKYDEHHNVVEETIKDFFKSSYKYHEEYNTFKYRYDKMENWIERIDYEHDIPMRMVVRTIEYIQ
jgi:YD repeat-containing protein